VLKRRTLKLIHLLGTTWFVVCTGYILLLSLRQAGVSWLIIFSFSGYSALLVFLVVCLYLFAIYKSGSRSQKIETEHPLTCTFHYKVFNLLSPFLGSLSGWFAMSGTEDATHFFFGIALGSFAATFIVWVVIDPIVGVLETLTPAARKFKAQRVAAIRAKRREQELNRKRLLEDLLAEERRMRNLRGKLLQPYAQELAQLVLEGGKNFRTAESKAVDIGLKAWQMGGLDCMRQLYDISIELSKKKIQQNVGADYISSWWDGIGTWRRWSPV